MPTQTPYILTILMGAGGATAVPCKGEIHALEILGERAEDWTEAMLSTEPSKPYIKTWIPTHEGIKEKNQ